MKSVSHIFQTNIAQLLILILEKDLLDLMACVLMLKITCGLSLHWLVHFLELTLKQVCTLYKDRHCILPATHVSLTPRCCSLPLEACISGSGTTFGWLQEGYICQHYTTKCATCVLHMCDTHVIHMWCFRLLHM